MNDPIIIGIFLWVLLICIWVIKDRKWLGVFQCATVLVAGVIMGLGEVFDFNGNIPALVFVLVVAGLFFIVKKIRAR
jgi:phage shock protein PspC (stress-responsive transcriptional regulator)